MVSALTALPAFLSTFLFEDFSKASGVKGQGPKTFHEHLEPVSDSVSPPLSAPPPFMLCTSCFLAPHPRVQEVLCIFFN
uniref:Uncharacterized protein n=1 Tax=Lynx canadensis TaxID=61383 RepID=A0A667H5M5_LYNCA